MIVHRLSSLNLYAAPSSAQNSQDEGKQQQLLQHQQAWGVTAPAAASAPAATRIARNFDPSVAVLWSDYIPPTDVSLHGLLVASTHLLADPR